jgi:hypothetical protein
MAGTAGVYFAILASQKGRFAAGAALLAANLLLLVAAISQSMLFRRCLPLKLPVIEMDVDTFYDRRICLAPIPWSAISWQAIHIKSGSIQMDVDADYRHQMRSTFADGLATWYCRLLGYPRYTVSPLATGHTSRELEEIFSQFKTSKPKR